LGDTDGGRAPDAPEGSGACNEDADLIRGYADLLGDHVQAERDDYLEKHPQGGGGPEARNQKIEVVLWVRYLIYVFMALVLILMGVAVVSGTGVLDSSPEESSTGSGTSGEEAAGAAAAGDEAAAEDAGLIGTWRIFMDDSEATPIYDIPFSPKGTVAVLAQGGVSYTVTGWDYSVSGDDVVVNLQCRTESGDGTVIDWPEKLEMELEGEEMRGTWSGEQWEYTDKDGLERGSWTVVSPSAYGRPL
jgi:hypothetical protein